MLVSEMVREARKRSNLPISIKIRICDDLRKTIDMCQMIKQCGISFITVHGRTVKQKAETDPVNVQAIKLVKTTETLSSTI